MKIRTVTWNIGAGKLLTPGTDPNLIASYGRDGLEEVAQIIKDSNADIVALQEVEQKDGYDQVQLIAEMAGYEYYLHDSTSDSHIDKDCKLGHSILSKYPISNHRFGLFNNPQVKVEWEDGSVAQSFDKGFSVCDIAIGDTSVEVATLHLIPFRRFSIELDSNLAKEILTDVASSLHLDGRNISLVMGDFNINDSQVAGYLPELFDKYSLSEVRIDQPTTPKGRSYDHVLYRGLSLENMQIDSSFTTDHYPIICDFSVLEQ